MAWVQSHHAETAVWPFIHHGVNPFDGCRYRCWAVEGFDVRFHAAFHRRSSLSVKGGLVQMGVGVDEVHGAKLVRKQG